MGRSELLLVLGALILFGLTRLSTNRYMVDQNESIIQREYEFYAISLAQSFIEEGKTKAYDVAVINASPPVPSGFTGNGGLGPAAGEFYPNFNDIDDYNGLSLTDSTSRGNFDIDIIVGYIKEATPEIIEVNQKTFHKKMIVTVTNPFLIQPVQLDFIFSYFGN